MLPVGFQSTTPDRVRQQPDKHAYPYWMVWGPKQGPAKKRHASAASATQEADRLAHKHPSTRFYVICVIGSVLT